MKTSPSSMLQFKTCGLRWKFAHDKLPGIYVPDDEARLGLNFHTFIIPTFYSRISDKPTPAEIREVAEKAFEEYFDPSLSHFSVRAKACLKNFIEFEQDRLKTWQKYKPEFLEENMESQFFKGRVDFYGNETIIDWKTGSNDEMTPDYALQGAVYKHLAESKGYTVKQVLFVLLYANKVLKAPLLQETYLMEQKRHQETMVTNNMIQPNPGPWCNSCPFVLRHDLKGRSLWM